MAQATAEKVESIDVHQAALESARRAGLRYVHDRSPGFSRHRRGKHFSYLSPDGKPLRDPQHLDRIRMLAIPPAWREVWICTAHNGHIQATGRDVKGRKQYRYHNRFREVRDQNKYEKIFDFVAALPKIRAQCARDLGKPGLSRDKVLALVVSLLEQTLIRVGNEEYSRLNQSFGLTTLRDRHARIRGADVQFRFRGKSGKDHTISFHDARLAKIVKRCRDLPGDELFQYLDDDGGQHTIDSSDVNDYLRRIAEDDFTAKDFRTWAGTLCAALALAELGIEETLTKAKRQINEAIKRTAERLGNTPAICRKSYIHPIILSAYHEGRVVPRIASVTARMTGRIAHELHADEQAVVRFLKRQLSAQKRVEKPGGLTNLLSRSVKRQRKVRKDSASIARMSVRAKSKS